ncbi:carboxymuconolactone decarboxylase family protein [Phascolarctobacterium succinatutens]|uniref:carboxymuconolactone decarboxylase family protein n=1 Tax=Phascolarctobacterium succinatutens TaxID=626940 RepID=UPI0026E9EA9D|nr:carboxymuconolactone decarboxylase family protein [Phascolarctobacterium succinatutens]
MKGFPQNLILALALIASTYAAGMSGVGFAASSVNCDRTSASTQVIENLYGKNNSIAFSGDEEASKLMQNFIYNDVNKQSRLTLAQQELITLVVLAASSTTQDIPLHVQAAIKAGATPEEIRETILQTTPYIGITKARPALIATHKYFKKAGVKLPLADAATVNDSTRYENGLAIQKKIFGAEHIERGTTNTPADAKFIREFLAANCFGDYYTRKVLDLKQREMITFIALASLGGCDSQLRSHVGANISVGNSRQDLLNTLTIMLPYIGYPRTLNTLSAINAVAPAK